MIGLHKNKFISGLSGIAFLLLCFVLFCGALPAGAQQDVDVVVANLQANAKLRAPNGILADFINGEPETAVIVLLKPTSTAMDLASKSLLSAQVPAEFTGPGAATYYELQNETLRAQLQATVTENVNRVIGKLGSTGMTVTQRFSYQFGFAAKVTPEALEQLVNSPDVVAVEKDHILQAHLAQGIPLMNAGTVRSTYTGSGLSIAICDTGIDTSHPRLGGGGFPNSKVIGGYDTGDNNADPRPDSVNGEAHGTACAGIAAGYTGTVSDYIGGVAPDSKLYAIKISTGNTGSAATSAMIAGWEWAVTHKNDDSSNPIMIISTSFGGGSFASTCDSESTSMTTAAANAVAAGITIFASSGNDGYCGSMAWPACISYVNSVGAVYDGALGTLGFCVNTSSCATNAPDSRCSSGKNMSWDATASNKVTVYSNTASFLTLLAPSHNAYTTDIVGPGGHSTGDYYTTFGGTSAACPYAAGSAALLQQAAKVKTGSYLTPAQVKTYLVNNGDNVTDGKVAVTKPRINLARAVNALPTSGGIIPGAPTIGTATAGNGSATVSFTPPASNGGSAITGYTVTSSPGSITKTGAASPITVTGLTNGTAYTFTVKATNAIGTGNASAASNSVTPSSGSGGGTTNLLLNPGFESGAASWGQSGSEIIVSGNAHNGSNWYAWLGGYVSGTDKLSQNVTIPANATSALLDFYTLISSDEGTSTPYDFLYVAIADPPSNTQLITLRSLSNMNQSSAWQHIVNFDMSAYKGKTVGLYFMATNDSSLSTSFYIDDVTLAVTTPGSTTYTVTPSAGANGGISPNSVQTVNSGSTATFTITPAGGYKTVTPVGGTCPQGTLSGTSYTTGAITANCTVAASFVSSTTVPGAPTIGMSSSGNTQATVRFTAPVSNGGSPITGYTVTSSPGNITRSGSASPIIVTGLTNGTSYTFTVKATNAIGTGPASAASNSVTIDSVDGDINGNGAIEISDALVALRITVNLDPQTPNALSRGDMNKSGQIDISDALYILRKVVGLI